MASLGDIGVSGFINILFAFAFLLAFAILRIQPVNDRVYFSKWYMSGDRQNPRARSGNVVGKFVNLNLWTYITFLNWIPQALRMSQDELIKHAGLDSAIYLRIYILGLKIFAPWTILSLVVLIPVNLSGDILHNLTRTKEVVSSDIDSLSISNVNTGSQRFWVHIILAYLLTMWTCYVLYKEYAIVQFMRLHFLASQDRRVDQFAVLVRNVPDVPGHSLPETVDDFFRRNHPDHYLGHQAVYNANKFAKLVKKKEKYQSRLDYYEIKFEKKGIRPLTKKGFLGFFGERVDAIDYYRDIVGKLDKKLADERKKILEDTKSVLPVAFVTFDSRWGASVCAQSQQSKNPTKWLTEWAPEPRDVYWQNLAIPFVSRGVRKVVISVLVFLLIFFYMIPIAFVQSLANLDGLEKVAPFLRPVIELKIIKSFLQGFLPGLALKLFLHFLPSVLMVMSKAEGYISRSSLERRTAAKYYYFMLVNVFLGSIVTGTAFEQLYNFIHQSPTQIPRTIGLSIPMKATFFITYIMVDGWAGVASEILRLKQLVIYHLKNIFIVKSQRDREKAMYPGSFKLPETLPTLQLYFLLGLVYAVVTPVLLPFILVFFAFAFLVYRHQIINVYNQEYESAGAFWPHVHTRIIWSLLISQIILIGILSTKKAASSTPVLILLPIATLLFQKYCKKRFEPAFRKYPLEEATEKDTVEQTSEPNLNVRAFLADAYLHPILRSFEDVEMGELRVDKNHSRIASVDKNRSHMASPPRHEISSASPPTYVYSSSPPNYSYPCSPPHYVYHSDV